MMRLTSGVVLAVSFLFSSMIAAFGGDYHTGDTLKCYQCHLMHSTKSHEFADDPSDGFLPGGAVTTSGGLLITSDANVLCLGCHDGGEAIDVYGDAQQGGQPALRSAGRFNNDATAPYAPFASPYGHDLKNGMQTPPGGSGSYDLDCGTCHDPHGNSYYRNLRDFGAGGITYAKSANDPGMDVFESKPYPANGMADAYDAANMSYNLPDSSNSHI